MQELTSQFYTDPILLDVAGTFRLPHAGETEGSKCRVDIAITHVGSARKTPLANVCQPEALSG